MIPLDPARPPSARAALPRAIVNSRVHDSNGPVGGRRHGGGDAEGPARPHVPPGLAQGIPTVHHYPSPARPVCGGCLGLFGGQRESRIAKFLRSGSMLRFPDVTFMASLRPGSYGLNFLSSMAHLRWAFARPKHGHRDLGRAVE